MSLPQFVITKIDRMCRTFVWTGNLDASKKSPVAWKTVCSPKSHGGQGIINLTMWNKITMIKCLWNLCRKFDNMWVKCIHMYYLKRQNVMEVSIVQSNSWLIKRIMELRDMVQQYQQVWDRMLNQRRFKMKALYDVMSDGSNLVEWRFLFQRNVVRP